MESKSKIKSSNLIPKDIIPIYTILALLAKSIWLISLLLNKTHQSPMVRTALKTVFVAREFRTVYYVGFILLIIWFVYLFKNRMRLYASILVNLLVSFLLLVDLWYMRGFNTLPTLHILQASGNMGDTMSSFLALISWKDILFVLDIPVLLAVVIFKKNFYRNVPRNIIFSFALLILSICSILFIAPGVNSISSKSIPTAWIFSKTDATNITYNISPLGYGLYSSFLYFTDDQTIKLSQNQRSEIEKWFESKKEDLPDNEYKGMFKGKNLLSIQFESLENFVLNQKINGQEVTPTLNKILKNSLFFSNVHEQVGGGNSSDSDLLINTSVYPIALGSTFYSNPFTYYNSFPKLFKEMGYHTSTIHPVNGAFWNWMPAEKSMGFDKCYDSSSYKIDEKLNMGISDGSYFNQIEPIIAKQKQPFYTFLVTLSSHTPFELAAKYRGLKLDDELDKSKLGDYLQCIHYSDKQLGLLFEKLQKDGVLDNTVVAIYGDHEGIHKYFPEDIEGLKKQEEWWKSNNKQIPLIVYNKSLNHKEVKTIGGQVDSMPTLAYLMGVNEDRYINTAMGKNLLKTNKNYTVLRDRTIVGNADNKDKELAIQGLELADEIIRGNYFR